MAIYTETKIAEALFERLSSLTLTPAMPVAWPFRTFAKPANGKWLRVNELPAPTRAASLDGMTEYSGLAQIDVMWPLGDGVKASREVAGAVTSHFERGTRIAREGISVEITGASISAPLRDDDRMMTPVTITYRCFA